ncbi:MAG: cytochrome c oxidase subunit 3 family protein [Isosphaeraceae bacterium]
MAETAQTTAAAPPAEPDHGHGHGHAHHPNLQHHFEDLPQQRDASTLGMWAFLATEVMFFSAVIGAYLVYRFSSPDVWGAASRHLNVGLATVNTVVLLTSSLAMALAVHGGETGDRKSQVRWLLATMALGSLFLVFKGFEYYQEYEDNLIPGRYFDASKLHIPSTEEVTALSAEERAEVATTADTASVLTVTPPQFAERRAQMFFVFYFTMTGLHAVHMVIGLAMLAWILSLARKGVFTPAYYNPLEMAGLYWHFIDIVWVFLYPLLYLVALHK